MATLKELQKQLGITDFSLKAVFDKNGNATDYLRYINEDKKIIVVVYKNIAFELTKNSKLDLQWETKIKSIDTKDYTVYEITKNEKSIVREETKSKLNPKNTIIGVIIVAIVILMFFVVWHQRNSQVVITTQDKRNTAQKASNVYEDIGNLTSNNNIKFTKYTLDDVGYIFIPDNMEMQSGEFKKGADSIQMIGGEEIGYKPLSNRVVFQPKGANQFDEKALENYARVIIQTHIGNNGDYENLATHYTATEIELNEIDTDFREQNEVQLQKAGGKIIEWNKVKLVKINGVTAIKLHYIRKGFNNKNKPVIVEVYYIQNNDRIHSLTLSYRQSGENLWEPLFSKVIDSFTITNVK